MRATTTRRALRTTLTGSLLLGALACSSVSSRIKEDQRQFNSYPPEVQAQIENGRIDRGFTEEMVYMAKGKPADKVTIEREGKKLLIWKYESRRPAQTPSSAGGSLATPYGYPTFGPNPANTAPVFYEHSYVNVEFENGKVLDWDYELQGD